MNLIALEWPYKILRKLPDAKFQSFTVLSFEPVKGTMLLEDRNASDCIGVVLQGLEGVYQN